MRKGLKATAAMRKAWSLAQKKRWAKVRAERSIGAICNPAVTGKLLSATGLDMFASGHHEWLEAAVRKAIRDEVRDAIRAVAGRTK